MGIVQHTINGRAIAEAIRTNDHVDYLRGQWFTVDAEGKPTGGCALGLAAINLGVRGDESRNPGANLLAQLRGLRVPPESRWYVIESAAEYNTVGDNIIYWNDKNHYEAIPGQFDSYGDPRQRLVYDLSFEEVHQMAHDLLEPHFNTEFVVDVWEFDLPNFG